MDDTVSSAGLADWFSCSQRRVNELAAKGVIARDATGAFPLKASVRAYSEYMRKQSTGRGGPAAVARARLAKAQAEAVELKNAHSRGTLLDSSVVLNEWAAILTRVRARLLAIPSRLSLPRADLDALDREIRSALEALAEGASEGAGPDGPEAVNEVEHTPP